MTLKDVLTFDVTRILRWDIGRALRRPIPVILLKAVAGYLVAGLVLAVVVPPMVRRGWPLGDWVVFLIMLACVGGFVGSDVRRAIHRLRR